MTRRTWGEGSRGRSPNGRFWGAYTLATGKRRYVYGKTKDERDARMDELLREIKAGRAVGSKTLTVAQYLSWWLEQRQASGSIKPGTLSHYRLYVDKHLVPSLGKHRLDKLSPSKVQDYLNHEAGVVKSINTVHSIRATLRAALSHAERLELVGRNVAKLIEMPQRKQFQVEPMDPHQASRLIEESYDERLGSVYVVCAGLGLRLGEALGLCWSDLDFERKTVHVWHQLRRVEHVLAIVELKRGVKHNRTLGMPVFVCQALCHRLVEQKTEKLAAKVFEASDLVFTRTNGRPVDGTVLNHQFHRFLTRIGLPQQRLHDLRHLAASLAIDQGASLKEVSEMLGHSQISITADLYAHLYEGTRKKTAQRMDDAISGS